MDTSAVFTDKIKRNLGTKEFENLKYLCRHSELIAKFLLNHPEIIDYLYDNLNSERSVETIFKSNEDLLNYENNEADFLKNLRIMRMREYLLIAYKDMIEKGSIKDITANISSFASIALEAAYKKSYEDLISQYGIPLNENNKECAFCIIGLGKLGGWELNFSSDVDIMFVYETEKGSTEGGIKGSLENHMFFVKLAEKIKYFISENTEDGIVYRVDLRLRPDGDKGAIALPLRSYELYYESYGQSWERMMLLKSLPVAGSLELGRRFFEVVKPFVFKKSIDYKLIDELSRIKSKINERVKYKKDKMNVKLGKGGIREIEFIIQVLQILNYSKYPDVYRRNSLDAIRILNEYNLLGKDESVFLSEAYIFLRKLEHMAQIEKGLQTHRVPFDSQGFDKFLERCEYTDKEHFFKDYDYYTSNVNRIFNDILKENEVNPVSIVFDEEMGNEDIAEYLESIGIKDAEECAGILAKIVSGRKSRPRSASETQILARLLSLVINEVKTTPNPLTTLGYFEKFFSTNNTIHFFFDIFCEMPKILSKITTIFSISPYLSNIIIKNNNILDYIYDPKNPFYKEDELFEILYKNIEDIDDDEEYEYDSIRKKHQELLFNISYAYINKDINVIQFNRSLSKLAKATVRLAFIREGKRLTKRFGKPKNPEKGDCGYAVIGMGKLGSEEMSLGTDLDMIVLYEEDGETLSSNSVSNKVYYSKLVQKVISFLSTITVFGQLYKIDMRLRPSGASGTLVTSLKSFENYQREKAMTWEKQSMLRADVIYTSARGLRTRFDEIRTKNLFDRSITKKEIYDIHEMRQRIEKEKGTGLSFYDIKAGFGGIVDIEFVVQMLQLVFGCEYDEIRVTNTHDALHSLKKLNLLSNRDFYALHNCYLFYRNLENLIRAYQNTSSSRLPKDKNVLSHISTFFGFKENGYEKLFKEYEAVRKTVRSTYNRIFERYL